MAVTTDVDARLRALEQRYAELEAQLAAPDAYADIERVQRLSQEQARLREIVTTGRDWRAASRAAREAEELAHAESDVEMVALAEEELEAQRRAEAEALTRLRGLLLLQPADQLCDVRDLLFEVLLVLLERTQKLLGGRKAATEGAAAAAMVVPVAMHITSSQIGRAHV